MIDAPLALAFGAGMVATVNPCGFAMLPAYLSYFLGADSSRAADAESGVLRAVVVGAVVSAGFVLVFGSLGLAVTTFSLSVYRVAPWLTVVIGVALVVLGVAMLRGFELTVRLPKLEKGTTGRGLSSMLLFGISYAVASLSCSLPVFFPLVSGTVGRANLASGMAMFGAYSAGMALVLMALTVALALARLSLVRTLRSALPYVNRVAGALLVLAGAYVAWFGVYELRLNRGASGGAGPVSWVTDLSSDLSAWVDDVGAVRLGVVLTALLVAAVLFAVGRRDPSPGPPGDRS